MIKSTLTVLEADGIESKIKFQGKTERNKGVASSRSCALELVNNRVTLYLRRDKRKIDYYQVASTLARFVMKKLNESYFDSIDARLQLPFDVLRQRGIPVDRLVKHVHRPIPVVKIQPPISAPAPPPNITINDREESKKRSPFRWFAIFYPPAWRKPRDPIPNEPSTHIRSNIHISSVPDFRSVQDLRNVQTRKVFKGSRTFDERKLEQRPNEKHELIETCTLDPGMNMLLYPKRFHSMLLYVEKGLTVTESMISHANEFARVISDLATQVFRQPVKSFHLFRDIQTGKEH